MPQQRPESVKRRVWQLIETAEGEDPFSRAVDVFIVSLIVVSTLIAILDSVPGLLSGLSGPVRAVEWFVVAVFSVEYVLRLWSCTADPRYQHPLRGRFRYASTPLALVDLFAIVPFYLPWFLPRGLLFLRMLRLVRLLRLYKFGRYWDAPALVLRAMRRRRAELFAATFVLLLLLVTMASLLYLVENPARPDVYTSIPESMWWSILALTGNGQVAPITLPGRLVASVIAIIGVGLFAVPAGLLASSFTEELGGGAASTGVGEPDVERVTERVALAYAARRFDESHETSVAEDYDGDALIVLPTGSLRGADGAPGLVSWLAEVASGASWHLESLQVAGTVAVLRWHAEDPRGGRHRVIEMLVVRDGLIQLQSVDRIAMR